jgi:hypothetical protein
VKTWKPDFSMLDILNGPLPAVKLSIRIGRRAKNLPLPEQNRKLKFIFFLPTIFSGFAYDEDIVEALQSDSVPYNGAGSSNVPIVIIVFQCLSKFVLENHKQKLVIITVQAKIIIIPVPVQ